MYLKKPHLANISKLMYLLGFGIILFATSCQKERISDTMLIETSENATESTSEFDHFIWTKVLSLPVKGKQNERFKAMAAQFKNQISAEQLDLLNQQFQALKASTKMTNAQSRTSEVGASFAPDDASSSYGGEVAEQGDFLFVGDEIAQKVHIYHQRGGSYQPIQELSGPDGFGSAIGISRNWLAVTAIGQEDFTGEVHIFARKGDHWTLSQILTPSDTGGSLFGRDIAMYGNRMALIQEGMNGSNGIVVYKLENSRWVRDAKLASGNSFWSLDMSSTRLVGNGFPNILMPKVFIYGKTANGWVEEAILPIAGILSRSIAIDGNTIMASTLAPKETISVFSAASGTWQAETPILLDIPFDVFPAERKILLAGNNLAVSVPVAGDDRDAIHFYNKDFRSWREVDRLRPSEDIGEAYDFGTSLTLTSRGKIIVGSTGSFCFCEDAIPANGRVFVY